MKRSQIIRLFKVITYIGIYGGLLMPLIFWPVVIFPFVFSKLAFLQLLIGITFPAYVALAWLDSRYRPKFSLLYVAIIAYFFAVAASVIFSVDVARSWWGNQERMNGLFTLLHFLAWLTMTIGVIKTWPQWRRLLNYQVALSGFMAIIAILQKPFPNLLLFPAGDRVGGLLDNPIYMAAYQIFSLFFIALLWMKSDSRQARLFYTFVALLDIAAFILAQSRGALVGLGIGVLVFCITYAILTPSRKTKKRLLAFVSLCFISYGFLFAFRNTEFIQNSTLSRFTNFSVASRTRFIAWDIAWKGFIDRPLTGSGLDTFHITFNEKYNPESLRFGYYETWFDRAHNTMLDVISMTGLFGLVTFAAIFISLYTCVVRAYRKKWIDASMTSVLVALPVAYFVQNLFVFDHPALFSMSYLLYAFVIAISVRGFSLNTNELPQVQSDKVKNVNTALILLVILEVAALFMVWRTTILPFRASMISIASNKAYANGNFEDAYRYAEKAFSITTPYLDEQSFLQSRNFISLAGTGKLESIPNWREWHDLIIRVSNKRVEEHPKNAHSRFIFARFAESLSRFVPEDSAISETQYKKAIELSPKRQQLYYGYARFLIDRGRSDEAVALLNQVISFDVEQGESYWLLGLHQYFDRGEKEEGAKNMILAVESTYSYVLKTGQEAMALVSAYDQVGEKEKIKEIIAMLPNLPQAQLGVYVEIARAAERQGLIEERNMILDALGRLDHTFAARLLPLVQGNVTSINDALKMTEGVDVAPPSSEPEISTPVATTSGAGPRIK
ncbi:O-antigen ligase family protein [Patescibacteria group bacterium]|nr:O-antigen ligase family protein [Patescibacteria group bacterium]